MPWNKSAPVASNAGSSGSGAPMLPINNHATTSASELVDSRAAVALMVRGQARMGPAYVRVIAQTLVTHT
jgi:hypothetical protein